MNTPQEFADLLAGMRRIEAGGFGGGAALATLTRTRGSTFRRPGARMLVSSDGSVVRALAGGCPQADIVARACEVIREGRSRVVRYDREHGLDAMIEMGCGGELEVLIEPLMSAADLIVFDRLERCLAARASGFLATAFMRDGRCLTPKPRRLLWTGGVAQDELGDAALTQAVLAHGEAAAAPRVERITSEAGAFDVLIELLRPPPALLVFGVNAGALALGRLATTLGWTTTLVDHRPELPEAEALPHGARCVHAEPATLGNHVSLDPRSCAVVMTHNLERDIAWLKALREAPLAYLGAIGSRARAARLFEATGLSPPRLRAPAGLDLGSETPEEIALAIAAEMLAATTGHAAGSLCAGTGPLHG